MKGKQESVGGISGKMEVEMSIVVVALVYAVIYRTKIISLSAQIIQHLVAVFVRDLDPEIFVEVFSACNIFRYCDRHRCLVLDIS